jgi:hypothetical protein
MQASIHAKPLVGGKRKRTQEVNLPYGEDEAYSPLDLSKVVESSSNSSFDPPP